MSKDRNKEKVKCLISLLSFLLLFILSGCSDSTRYHPGWYTSKIEGQFNIESPKSTEKSFILVQQYNQGFTQTSQGYLHSIIARVVFPDKEGHYQVEFPGKADRLDLFFYRENHLQQMATFNRSLGIGTVEFNVNLKKDQSWKNNFFFAIKPFLSGFIVEPHYKLPPADQLFLSNWLDEQSSQLVTK